MDIKKDLTLAGECVRVENISPRDADRGIKATQQAFNRAWAMISQTNKVAPLIGY